MMMPRRLALTIGLSGLVVARSAAAMPTPPAAAPAVAAGDEAHWARIAELYDVAAPPPANLENGYWGIMATPVAQTFLEKVRAVNHENTLYARTRYGADLEAVRGRVAAALGVAVEEVALTRGATEALQNLIANYNRLKPGDAVLYADLDYDSMQYVMEWLAERRGVRVVRFAIPEPATRANVLQAYAEALRANPDVRLLLATHVSHRTGLLLPSAEIVAMARQAGADVILDAAHGWGQVPFDIRTIGADFVGLNLHKWIGAPLGVGAMYVRRERLGDIDRHFGDGDWPAGDIRSRVHTGTAQLATFLAVPAALDLQDAIGPEHKIMRLKVLRDRWVAQVRDVAGLEILTSDEPGMSAAITSIRLKGKGTRQDSNALAAALLERGVFSVRRGGVAGGEVVRLTPSLFNDMTQMDHVAAALTAIARG